MMHAALIRPLLTAPHLFRAYTTKLTIKQLPKPHTYTIAAVATVTTRTTTSKMAEISNNNPQTSDPYTAKAKANQPTTSEKLSELTTFMTSQKFGMLATYVPATGQITSRAMALAATEAKGVDLLFHTNTESGKTDSIQQDGAVNMSFLDSSGQWASVTGNAAVETDRELVKKYYSPSLKAWLGDLGDGKHDGGPEDPRIGIIRLQASLISFGVTDKTIVGRAYEIAKGTVTGETPGFIKVRDLSESEIKSIRQGA